MPEKEWVRDWPRGQSGYVYCIIYKHSEFMRYNINKCSVWTCLQDWSLPLEKKMLKSQQGPHDLILAISIHCKCVQDQYVQALTGSMWLHKWMLTYAEWTSLSFLIRLYWSCGKFFVMLYLWKTKVLTLLNIPIEWEPVSSGKSGCWILHLKTHPEWG